MPDLMELIDKWKNSALNFREAERLINLLIVDSERLERRKKGEAVTSNSTALLCARECELITAGLYLLECQADSDELHYDMVSDFERGGGLPKEGEPRKLMNKLGT